MTPQEIRARLFAERDEAYAAFQAKLMPTVPPGRIIGVRTPILRRLAKELAKAGDNGAFLAALPHAYYDENNLHGFLISEWRDYDETVSALEAFLPCVDNWATCDLLSPRAFRRHRDRLPADIERWLSSPHPFTVRFGIEMIQTHFLDEDFSPAYLERVAAIRREEYYVNMMIAWYFATALTKQWDSAVPYIEQKRLAPWTHNKAIQKATESRCITDEQKAYLRTFRIK